MIVYPETITKFDWQDLHGKILKIGVAQPNPECLEFFGQVFGLDVKTGTTYVLFEWDCRKDRYLQTRDTES